MIFEIACTKCGHIARQIIPITNKELIFHCTNCEAELVVFYGKSHPCYNGFVEEIKEFRKDESKIN